MDDSVELDLFISGIRTLLEPLPATRGKWSGKHETIWAGKHHIFAQSALQYSTPTGA